MQSDNDPDYGNALRRFVYVNNATAAQLIILASSRGTANMEMVQITADDADWTFSFEEAIHG